MGVNGCGKTTLLRILSGREQADGGSVALMTGLRLGYVCDAEFDDAQGQMISLITPGRAKWFGLFGREDDYVLPWKCIVRIGSDIILIDAKEELRRRKRSRRFLV